MPNNHLITPKICNMKIPDYLFVLINSLLPIKVLSDKTPSNEVLSNEVLSKVLNYYSTNCAGKPHEVTYGCKSEDYGNIDSVRKKVCIYKLYNLPDFDSFVRAQHVELVPVEQRFCFDISSFKCVGLQMFALSFDSAKNPEEMRKFWCG